MVYRLIRLIFRIAMRVFFSRIEVESYGNVPETGPVILVSNHTNALVDGLVIGGCLRRPLTLTAKSTLAKKPLLDILMRAAGVIALHRRQDIGQGADMTANEPALARLRALLGRGGAVCLFPEGKSYSEPGIQPFKTGAARIALGCLEENENCADLLIVPTGLYFQKKSVFRSKAWIGFGTPIRVLQWSLDNPGSGARELTGLLEDRVRALALNFDERGRSELFTRAADLLATSGQAPPELGLRPQPRVAEQVHLVHALQNGFEKLRKSESARLDILESRMEGYRASLARHAVATHEVFLPMSAGRAAFFALRELELLVLGLPIALWGLLNHLLPLLLVRALAPKLTRDEDQFATNVVFISIVIFPVFYILQIIFAALFLPGGWLLLYLVSLPYSGMYAVAWSDRVRGAVRRTRTYLLWRLRPGLQQRLAEEGRDIIAGINRLAQLLEADDGSRA
jgi:1-acyl-sn-glycerol-3-phosphate acyltransferase